MELVFAKLKFVLVEDTAMLLKDVLHLLIVHKIIQFIKMIPIVFAMDH